MTQGIKTIIAPVKDLDAAKNLYNAVLGINPTMDEAYYVGYELPDGQQFGLDPTGHAKGMTGPVGYWHVTDIEAAIAAAVDAGGQAQQPVTKVGGTRRIATVTDADGNVIGLLAD